ncbi:hypothetical protein MKW98_008577 [Papaver atlanticum]|uniref:DNA-directed RNA polymerase subunit n=1 Tax=Papaver atlanticum TaxID=357466 RepID=A0AAD4TCR4_9MAGN|nr:hypothetical protein MKW98_008577 [Papaver atlanticum]
MCCCISRSARFSGWLVIDAIRGGIILAKLSVILVRIGYWRNNNGKPHNVPCKSSGKCGPVTVRMVPAPRGAGGRHGFVVAITWVDNVGKGLIRDGTRFVKFLVKYQCVVFRPFKGDILEDVVTMVNKMGFFAEAGHVQIFVSNKYGDIPNYTTSDGSVKIQRDSEVRLKIIGTQVDATEIVCSLTFALVIVI